jgi:hypothetical protein
MGGSGSGKPQTLTDPSTDPDTACPLVRYVYIPIYILIYNLTAVRKNNSENLL